MKNICISIFFFFGVVFIDYTFLVEVEMCCWSGGMFRTSDPCSGEFGVGRGGGEGGICI